MDDREVIAVGGIFQLDFPVAGKAKTVRGGGLQRVASPLFHEQIHPFHRRAEEVGQRFNVVVEAGENHSGVAFNAQAHHAELRFVQRIAVALWMRYPAQRAVEAIAPAVIRAGKTVRFPAAMFADGGGAVAAAVEQHVDIAFAIAHDDHRLGTHHRGFIAAGVRDFALVGDPYPGTVKNVVDFEVENFLGSIETGMDPVALHQCRQRFGGMAGIDIFYRNTFRHCHSPHISFNDHQAPVNRRANASHLPGG